MRRLLLLGWCALTALRAAEPIVTCDHPDDAAAAKAGRVNRNFQGFTEDDAPVLLGFGASAISRFPGLIIQNEKRAGPYRDLIGELDEGHGHLSWTMPEMGLEDGETNGDNSY